MSEYSRKVRRHEQSKRRSSLTSNLAELPNFGNFARAAGWWNWWAENAAQRRPPECQYRKAKAAKQAAAAGVGVCAPSVLTPRLYIYVGCGLWFVWSSGNLVQTERRYSSFITIRIAALHRAQTHTNTHTNKQLHIHNTEPIPRRDMLYIHIFAWIDSHRLVEWWVSVVTVYMWRPYQFSGHFCWLLSLDASNCGIWTTVRT